jgi:hypothetical protein
MKLAQSEVLYCSKKKYIKLLRLQIKLVAFKIVDLMSQKIGIIKLSIYDQTFG